MRSYDFTFFFNSPKIDSSISHGFTPIAKAIRYNSLARKWAERFNVNLFNLALLKPVFREISDLLTDFAPRYSPSLVIVNFDYQEEK